MMFEPRYGYRNSTGVSYYCTTNPDDFMGDLFYPSTDCVFGIINRAGKTRCEYCRAKIDRYHDLCPHCGAPLPD